MTTAPMPRSLRLLLALTCLVSACEDFNVPTRDAGAELVLCVARGSRLTEEGCLTAGRAFAEKFVDPADCLTTEETRCIQSLPDAGWTGVWIFSGEYFDGISGAEPCDSETRTAARTAPTCDGSTDCIPCDEDAGGLCGLAPPCN